MCNTFGQWQCAVNLILQYVNVGCTWNLLNTFYYIVLDIKKPGMSYNFLYKRLWIHQHVQVVCIYQKVFFWHQDGIMWDAPAIPTPAIPTPAIPTPVLYAHFSQLHA